MILAAGILFRDPEGRVLLLRRSAEGDAEGAWAFPGGKLEPGEDHATTAVRETLEETGFNPGSPGAVLARRVAGDVDYTTFVRDVEEQFVPKLNGEHTAYCWIKPEEVLPAAPVAAPLPESIPTGVPAAPGAKELTR